MVDFLFLLFPWANCSLDSCAFSLSCSSVVVGLLGCFFPEPRRSDRSLRVVNAFGLSCSSVVGLSGCFLPEPRRSCGFGFFDGEVASSVTQDAIKNAKISNSATFIVAFLIRFE